MTNISLNKVPLFKSLSKKEIQDLENSLKPRSLESGKILFKEGEAGNSFYIIVKGELEIIKSMGTKEERILYKHGAGDFVGEMSLLIRKGIRSASVRAFGETDILELNREAFDSLLSTSPLLAYDMVRELGDRLRDTTDSTVKDLRSKNKELTTAYEELQAAQLEIVEKEKLEHELNVARNIQMNILPDTFNLPSGSDFGAKMVPARAVGGDFYDFIELEENKVGIAIGDVSDKGVPAALFMAQLCTLLRSEAEHNENPKAVLLEVNRHMLRTNQAGMFATAIYGVYDTKTRIFNYARAGHELPIIIDPDGNTSEPPKGRGTPLCLFPDPPIDVQKVEVPKGHTLMLYTDGGTDAINNAEKFFGLEALTASVIENLEKDAQEICDLVIEKLLSYQESSQFDDATMAILRSI
ncbi:MAG: SpoIIE family protein phosphatase [Chloroflexota bacterium]